MWTSDTILDLISDNLNKLFFPEEWLALDMKFSKAELFLLLLLVRRQECTMSELAEGIHVPMSTATGMADRLVRRGYVNRERSEDDRRIVVLRLSEKGLEAAAQFKVVLSRYIALVAEDLTTEEQQALVSIVMKTLRKLESEAGCTEAKESEGNPVRNISIE